MRLAIGSSRRLARRAERDRLAPFLRRVASRIPPAGATVEVSWIGARAMARLNRIYKHRRGPAEILTFPCSGGVDPGGEAPLGEICLSWDRLALGARRRGVSTRAYAARLLVHGLFHLRGYGHGDDASAARMEAAEGRALRNDLTARDIKRLFA